MRLDVYLTEKKLCESRKKSSDSIKAGLVFVDGKCVVKPSFEVTGIEEVTLSGEICPYVGRGGFKLEKALDYFHVDPQNMICIDIGSSTGGFTDCLLQKGAKKVYAVDSGKDQLHQTLRNDSRVVCMEGVNARHLTFEQLGEKCDLAVMDVSFISQTLLYGCVTSVLKKDGLFISLIKPQFEVGKELVGKKGIVKSDVARQKACAKIREESKLFGLEIIDIIDSPILGGDGNKEFLALFKNSKNTEEKYL